jgi:hypothetical protein
MGSLRLTPHGGEVLPLDLASLDSVRDFADAVTRRPYVLLNWDFAAKIDKLPRHAEVLSK